MHKINPWFYSIILWIPAVIGGLNILLTPNASSFGIPQKNSIPYNIRVMFDLKNDNSLIWDGTVRVTEGCIDEIKGIGFEHDDKIYTQSNSWRCLLTKEACGPCGEVVTSKGITLSITSPLSATFVLVTKAGNFCVPIQELSLGKNIERYNGRLKIDLAPREFLLSDNNAQDDSPVIGTDKSSRIWTCWVSHKKGKDRIIAKKYDQGNWSDEMEVSTKAGRYYRPSVIGDPKEGIWVVWPAYNDGNWDLYARNYNGSGWKRVKRLTKHPSNDINQKMASDPFGNIWLCWESYKNGNSDIFVKCLSHKKWSREIQITKNDANDRQPDLAIDNLGKIYISWTRFHNGLYKILLKDIKSAINTEKVVAVSSNPLTHPNMVCSQDKVWIAWDEMKNSRQNRILESDTKNLFYARRSIGLCCYKNGLIYEPSTNMTQNFPFPLKQHAELPRLIIDKNGKLWVFFQNYVKSLPHSVWRIYGVYYQDNEWSQPILFPHYTWKNAASLSSCCDNLGNIWIAWASDNRDLGNSFLSDRDIYVGNMSLNDNLQRSLSLIPCKNKELYLEEEKPNNNQEIPFKTSIKGKECRLIWGSLYQPNNVKGYTGLDGFITEIYRTVMDVADLDFLGIGNYLSYDNKDYTYWLADKANCLFSEKNQFVSITIPEKLQNQLYQSFNNMAATKKSTIIGAFVTEISPESIQEALKNKRAYIATDKIFLDAKILGHPMGETFKTKESIPKIDISVVGTDELYQIDIFRNDACIYSKLPKGKSAQFSFLDMKMPKGKNYYSVQVIQKNGHEAKSLTAELNFK